jgi:hypothetical protein
MMLQNRSAMRLYTHEARFFSGRHNDVIDSTSRRDLVSQARPNSGFQLLALIKSRCTRWTQEGSLIGALSMGALWLGPASWYSEGLDDGAA